MAEAVFHIIALGWIAFIASTWSSRAGLNLLIKVAAIASAAFAAVIVAGDWLS